MRGLRMLAAVLPMVAAGCHVDVFDPDRRDFEGFYSYAGTVDDAAGDAVVGQITITRQRRDYALVAIDWSYLDQGVEVVRIVSEEPARAEIDHDGYIRFVFEGELFTDDDVVSFRLEHEGFLRGRTITGSWWLTTGLPTNDEGAFTARRD